MARPAEKYHAELFKKFAKLLASRYFYKQYLVCEKHFTRDRKLPFQKVVLILLQLLKSSLTTELKSFHTTVFNVDGSALNLPPSKELLDKFGHQVKGEG